MINMHYFQLVLISFNKIVSAGLRETIESELVESELFDGRTRRMNKLVDGLTRQTDKLVKLWSPNSELAEPNSSNLNGRTLRFTTCQTWPNLTLLVRKGDIQRVVIWWVRPFGKLDWASSYLRRVQIRRHLVFPIFWSDFQAGQEIWPWLDFWGKYAEDNVLGKSAFGKNSFGKNT